MIVTPITPVLSKKNALGGMAALFMALVLAGCWGNGNPVGGGEGGASLVTVANLGTFMKEVEGGQFKRGCRADKGEGVKVVDGVEVTDTTCLPSKDTTVAGFYICQYAVTQGLWKQVMGASDNPSEYSGDDLPVTNVTGIQINNFFVELNKKTADGIYNYRLPFETEWEYAARGGNSGNDYKYSGSDNPEDVAWYGKATGGPRRVNSGLPNELDIYGMSGNVWEVVGAALVNASRPELGIGRGAERGGSWFGEERYCRATYRVGVGSFTLPTSDVNGSTSSDRGFRIAATLKQ